MFWNYSANINNSLRFVRANVSQKMFSSLPTLVKMTKHRQETLFSQQWVLACPGFKDLMTWLLIFGIGTQLVVLCAMRGV